MVPLSAAVASLLGWQTPFPREESLRQSRATPIGVDELTRFAGL